jgi:acetyl esterase
LIFVAGRDSLRDEGIAYARKLETANVPVKLNIYQGVPHGFSMLAELRSSSKFREDFKTGIEQWVLSV